MRQPKMSIPQSLADFALSIVPSPAARTMELAAAGEHEGMTDLQIHLQEAAYRMWLYNRMEMPHTLSQRAVR